MTKPPKPEPLVPLAGDVPRPLPACTARRIAVAAACDPRTVLKWARGGVLAPLTRERIERAVRQLGLAPAATRSAEPR